MTELSDPPWLALTIAQIDAVNAADPVVVEFGGRRYPRELLLAQRATYWLSVLDPGADPAQQIAVRSSHLRRWEVPRSEYPDGRPGYLRWRKESLRRHAEMAATIMDGCGVPTEVVDRATALVRKEGLRRGDPRAQAHEDALCLSFVEFRLGEVADRLGEEATLGILVRTLRKMSPEAIGLAAAADLDPRAGRLLQDAERLLAGGPT